MPTCKVLAQDVVEWPEDRRSAVVVVVETSVSMVLSPLKLLLDLDQFNVLGGNFHCGTCPLLCLAGLS